MMTRKAKGKRYISLQEATNFCNYSQDYLSLRARQGKLEARKIGRNWVTTRDALKQYVRNVEKYENNLHNGLNQKNGLSVIPMSSQLVRMLKPISVICASALIIISIGTGIVFGYPFFEKNIIEPVDNFVYDFYSQSSTGARLLLSELTDIKTKTKLKGDILSVVSSVDDFVHDFYSQSSTGARLLVNELSEKGTEVRGSINYFSMGVKNIFQETRLSFQKISERILSQSKKEKVGKTPNVRNRLLSLRKLFLEGLKNSSEKLKGYVNHDINLLSSIISEINFRTEEIFKETKLGFKNIIQKISKQPEKMAGGFKEAVGKTTEKITGRFRKTIRFISYSTQVVSEAFEDGSQSIVQETKSLGKRIGEFFNSSYKFLVYPWSKEINEQELIEMVLEKRPEIEKGEIVQIRNEIEKLKKEGLTIKEITREVSKIVQIFPEKQITRETIITKIDDKELLSLKANILDIQKWGADIKNLQNLSQKFQPQSPQIQYVSSPVYIGSTGLQVGGAANFSSLVVSGQAGVSNLGVGGSTVLGYDANNKLTVNATSNFLSPVVFENILTVGTGSNYFTVDNNGNLSIVGTLTVVGTSTASTYLSDSDDSTVRKIDEEVMRNMVSIYRFGIPSQTSATSSYVRISKIVKENPFTDKPEVLPGATRIYRFNIKYADDLDLGYESQWRIYNIDNSTTTIAFTLPRTSDSGTLEEGTSYITEVIAIPTGQWQLELKLPVSGKSIRIFDIFLSAYDEIQ